jgi:uncharacterized protein YqeY
METTRQQLETALKDAMRSGNEIARRTIRMVLANIKFIEKEKGAPMEEGALLALLQKEIKSRRESIADAQKANRPDLVADSEAEIHIIEAFLPQPFSAADLEKLVAEAIAEVNAAGPTDMGKVMKVLMPRIQGRASGDQVNQAVRKLLQK